nr:Abi family protein [Allofustis seminis]
MLYNLASIDTYIREFLLSLCLDIEHTSKTMLMTDITYNNQEDGYHIVDLFKQKCPQKYNSIYDHYKVNTYLKDMFIKTYGSPLPIWALLELVDFGAFTMILDLYIKEYSIRKSKVNNLSKNLRYVRNACAHNNVFLLNVYNYKSNYIKRPTHLSKQIASKSGVQEINRFYNKPHDVLILFWIHKTICSNALNVRRHHDGLKVIERIKKSEENYKNSDSLLRFFSLLNKMIDLLHA